MRKLRNLNWYYLLGTLPFCLILTGLSVRLAGTLWQRAAILAFGAAATGWLLKKFWYLPRPEKEYGEMEPVDIGLLGGFPVQTYLCPKMDQYRFLKRNIEIISPLFRKSGEKIKIAISPELRKKSGDEFMRIAVMREVIRYCHGAQAKASLGFVVPILTAVCLAEGYYALGWNRIFPINDGYMMFFGPLVLAVSVILFCLAWNKQISRIDYQLDDELKQYFPREKIADYIEKWDLLLLPDEPELINEKSRQLELFYVRQRLERL